MRTTPNILFLELQAIKEGHGQLQNGDFFRGSFLRSQHQPEPTRYPLTCCYYRNGQNNARANQIIVYILVADRCAGKDLEGLNDTESDTWQCVNDYVDIMRKAPRWNKIGRVENAPIEKFIADKADEVTGHWAAVTFTLFDHKVLCDLPMFGYDYGGSFSPVCLPVTITDSDGTTIVEVSSGGSFSCTPVSPVTYTNSDGSATGSADPGDNIVFPDIEITTGSGTITRPSLIDLSLPNYYEIINATGIRVPVVSVSNPETQVQWDDIVGASVATGSITKTGVAGWNAGAAFDIDTVADYRVEFNYGSATDTGFAGISFINPDVNYPSIAVAVYNYGFGYQIYVGGSFAAPYNNQGVFPCKIEVIGTQAHCYINNLLIHSLTLSGANRGQMFFDCSMFNVGCKIENIILTYL